LSLNSIIFQRGCYANEILVPVRFLFISNGPGGGNGCRGKTNPGAIPVNEDSIRDHISPIKTAIALTSHFRMARDSFDRQIPVLESGTGMGQAEALKRDAIAVLLNQRDSLGREASGIRIDYGLDRNGQIRMVLVPQ
jgi:hypothetical protein